MEQITVIDSSNAIYLAGKYCGECGWYDRRAKNSECTLFHVMKDYYEAPPRRCTNLKKTALDGQRFAVKKWQSKVNGEIEYKAKKL